MQIQILCVGKIKDAYLSSGISEFEKRLKPYAKVFTTELAEVKIPENASKSYERIVMEKEGKQIISSVKDGFLTVALERTGKEISSNDIAELFGEAKISGGNICFIIGGPLGLAPEVLAFADKKISFSRLTFTHTMCRLILFEQIYRGFRILNKEPYHK